MKKGSAILLGLGCFIVGAVLSYIASQYKYFEMDTEVNVFDIVFSVLGLVIGFYIAVTLERQRSRGQNFYSYVEGKFDLLWQDFIKFSETLDYSSNIELSEVSKSFKGLYKRTTPLKTIFIHSDYNEDCIIEIEGKISSFDEYITSLNSNNNILNIDPHRDEIMNKCNEINECFASSYKTLNNIS